MTGIKCIKCSREGILEVEGVTNVLPISIIFKHRGHNPFYGHLRYQCPFCKTLLLVDPMDVLSLKFITDVRNKPKRKRFWQDFFITPVDVETV
jgi:hypothetical protein